MRYKLYCKSFLEKNHTIIFGFVVLSFILDFINKLEIFYDLQFLKFNAYLKLIFLAYAIIFISVNLKKIFKYLDFSIYSIIIILTIFLLKNNFSERYLLEFARYFWALCVFPLIFETYKKRNSNYLYEFYRLFKYLIIINTICVILGIVFKIDVFLTYKYDRLGYNGIILSQGMTPYIYCCGTLLFWEFKSKKLLSLILVLSILTGVKGVYLAQFLLLSLLVYYDSEVKYKLKILTTIFFIFFVSLCGLFMLPTFKAIISTKGLLSAIFSFRLDNTLEVISQITTQNYSIFIGTIDLFKIRLEMQLIDIILFFGSVGLVAYTYWFYFFYKKAILNKKSKIIFITILTISFFTGNFLYVPQSFLLGCIVMILINSDKE